MEQSMNIADDVHVLHNALHDDSKISGFWGPIDSTVDWCEPNYVVTFYIAEFFNTLSSIPMIFWGMIGILLTKKYCVNEWKYFFAFLSLCVVGIGSSLFHGTLRYYAQLFDELPMLYGSFALWYCQLFAKTPIKSNKKLKKYDKNKNIKFYENEEIVAIAMTLASIIITILYGYFQYYTIFVMSYGLLVAANTYHTIKTFFTIKSKQLFTFNIMMFASYYGALICWIIDNTFCKQFQNLNLHAIWHFGAGYGSYLWVYATVIQRGIYVKKQIQIENKCESLGAHFVKYSNSV